MRKLLTIASFILTLLCITMVVPVAHAATDLSDGTYTINYTVLKGDNDSVSMANDYWEKPATLIVENGEINVQMTLNHSHWIKTFKVASNGGFADVKVVSTDDSADKRVTQFKANDLSTPLESKIHVYIPEEEFPGNGEYDNEYTIRLQFDLDSITAVDTSGGGSGATNEGSSEEGTAGDKTNENGKQELTDNPRTSDTAAISLLLLILVGSSLFLIRQLKLKS